MSNPPALVLDLDHTLVHCHRDLVEGFDHFHVDLGQSEMHTVHVRPHALEFLTLLSQVDLSVVIWTAGTSNYALQVVEGLYRLIGEDDWQTHVCLLLTRKDTLVISPEVYVKDLGVVRRALNTENVLLMDDNPVHERLPQNEKKILRVSPFRATNKGADKDDVLAILGDALRKGLALAK
jgi:TFIIF-interacting CTD phosphatase-like protein